MEQKEVKNTLKRTLIIDKDDMKALRQQALDADMSTQSLLQGMIKQQVKHGSHEALVERNELLEIQLRKLAK